MSNTRKQKKSSPFYNYLPVAVVFTGLIISIYLLLIFIATGVRHPNIEIVSFLIIGVMFLSIVRGPNGASYRSYFHVLPWHGKAILAVIFLYILWNIFAGISNAQSANIHEIAVYHQTLLMDSIMIGGYTYFCYYQWWRINQH